MINIINTSRRYLKLFLSFVRFSTSRTLVFRFDASIRFFSDLCYYIAHVLFYKVLFLNYSNIGDWNEEFGMVFVWSFLVLDALHMTFMASSSWMTVVNINNGNFDFNIVRPVSSFFISFFKDINFMSFLNLLVALGMLIYSINNVTDHITVTNILTYTILMFCGFTLYFCIKAMVSASTFWIEQSERFLEGFFVITKLMEVPHIAYQGITKFILLTFIPFGLMVSFPVRYLSHGLTSQEFLLVISVTLFFMLATKLVWQAGTRVYSSPSS